MYFDRIHSGQQLIEGGESQHYLDNLNMYQQWTKADREGRMMQLGAVGIIGGSYAIGALADVAVGELLLDGEEYALLRAERVFNLGRRDIIMAIRYGLANRLTLTQIMRLEALARKYVNYNTVIKTGKQFYDLYKALKNIVK